MNPPSELSIKVIGIGGVGTILADKLSRFLNYGNGVDTRITFVDGDTFEPKNRDRQEFAIAGGKKSLVKASEFQEKYHELNYSAFDEYVNPRNVGTFIKSGDIVFVCVDNHKTRKIISDFTKTLSDIVVISGGNEFTDGNVQIFVRREGRSLTPSLSDYHPEIEHPKDRTPGEMTCEELAQSEPQLFFTNLGVATFMCFAFYNTVVKNSPSYSEVYFDVLSMKADSKSRKPLDS